MSRARDTAGIIQYNKITVDSNNAVGIGSSIPDCKLDINGGLRVVGVSTFEDSVLVPYDKKLNFGSSTGLEGQLYASTEYFYINSSASNGMYIQGNGFVNIRSDGGIDMFRGTENGSVQLYYNDAEKFQTTAGGVDITGITTCDGLSLGDSENITLGADDDLQIYHDGTNTYLDNNTNSIFIRSNVDDDDGGNIYIQAKSGENSILCNDDGAVQIYYNNALKIATNSTGIDVTGAVQGDSLDINGVADISGNVTLSGTGSIKVPVGTSLQRPTGSAGMFRYNSDEGQFEGYTTNWGSVGGFSQQDTWLFGDG